MSYFLFGLIDCSEREDAQAARAAASAEGMNLQFGDELRQRIVIEMLGAHSHTTSVPFVLTKSSTEDTSDSLISPYAVGVEGTAQALAAVGRWLVATLRSCRVERIRLWMTEGYDTAFEHLDVSPDRFANEIVALIAAEGDVPSLQVTIVK